MRLSLLDKVRTLASAVEHRAEIKSMLIRRHWQKRGEWRMSYRGVQATFATDDFYSNYWFYGPQDVTEVYEPAITRIVIDLARGAKRFVDVGANLGYYSVVAGLANPSLEVTTIELDESLGPIIQKNLDRNGIRARVVLSAVGDAEAEVPYQPHPYTFLSVAAEEATTMPDIILRSRSKRLDDIMEGTADLIKMDVDGAETIALRHSERLLANPGLVLLLEVHPHILPRYASSAAELGSFLTERGFRLHSVPAFRSDEKPSLQQLTTLGDLDSESGDMVLVTRRSLEELGLSYEGA